MTDGELHLVECPECEANVAARMVASIDVKDPPWALRARYCFLKCPKCGGPLLTAQSDDGPGWDPAVRVYPERDLGLGVAVPSTIQVAFNEARSCFGVKAYTAAAIMCRKATEGLCDDQGAAGRTLADRLKTLRDTGVIEARLFEWADTLRISGNEAAHAVTVTVSKADAADLLEFTKALAEYVYTFGQRFDEFKERRKRRASR